MLDWLHNYQFIDCSICSKPVPALTKKLFFSAFQTNEVNLVSRSQLILVKALQTVLNYDDNILWSKFWIIAASDSQSICALRWAWETRKLHTICCLHERDFALGLSRRWNRPHVSDHGRERFLHRVAQNIIGIANHRYYFHGGNSSQTRSRQASLASCE